MAVATFRVGCTSLTEGTKILAVPPTHTLIQDSSTQLLPPYSHWTHEKVSPWGVIEHMYQRIWNRVLKVLAGLLQAALNRGHCLILVFLVLFIYNQFATCSPVPEQYRTDQGAFMRTFTHFFQRQCPSLRSELQNDGCKSQNKDGLMERLTLEPCNCLSRHQQACLQNHREFRGTVTVLPHNHTIDCCIDGMAMGTLPISRSEICLRFFTS